MCTGCGKQMSRAHLIYRHACEDGRKTRFLTQAAVEPVPTPVEADRPPPQEQMRLPVGQRAALEFARLHRLKA